MFDSCTENCAWVAAIISCVSFGSFGVPIKSPEAKRVQVDPLVFQSYKTIMCLLTSWLVIPMGQDFYFTPWGIVSGLFWVPAGIAAIYAIQQAGLAVSQGVWSSLIVLVSFIWGIFVFEEKVKSKVGASVAVLCMMIGLWGMSFYSSPESIVVDVRAIHNSDIDGESMDSRDISSDNDKGIRLPPSHVWRKYEEIEGKDDSDDDEEGLQFTTIDSTNTDSFDESERKGLEQPQVEYEVDHNHNRLERMASNEPLCSNTDGDSLMYGSKDDADRISENQTLNTNDLTEEGSCDTSHHLISTRGGISLLSGADNDSDVSNSHFLQQTSEVSRPRYSQRFLGLSAAIFNGVWGGSIMVPMQFAPANTKGTGYVISFAIGASIITIALWLVRYLHLLYKFKGSFFNAYIALPPFHIKVMWKPGGLAGSLWSLGNLSSMVSVHLLGEGVGYSVTQASMLVSGLWGIFYFKEVTGTDRITKWLMSSIICIVGIIWLSYEHE